MSDPREIDMDMDDVIGGGPQGEWGDEGQEDDRYDAYKELDFEKSEKEQDAILERAKKLARLIAMYKAIDEINGGAP
jgi:hypothetical protein